MEERLETTGVILDADYVTKDSRGIIRLTFRSKDATYVLLDPSFVSYFYLVPNDPNIDEELVKSVKIVGERGDEISAARIEKKEMRLFAEMVSALKVFVETPRNVPTLSRALEEFGKCYEDDVVFWKRYLIDKNLSPLEPAKVSAHLEGKEYIIDSITKSEEPFDLDFRYLCFDIETYNPLTAPRPEKDPVLMISYSNGTEKKVLTTKKIEKDFVKVLKNEKEMIEEFTNVIKRCDPDLIVGYNSSNFDLPYLDTRAKKIGANFEINRISGEVRKEHHGLIDAFKIPGRSNVDIYNVAKFVSVVGAAVKLIKVNSFTLAEVYKAITGTPKKMVERKDIWKVWDEEGKPLEELADYSLGDSLSLEELFKFFIPLEIEVAKVSGTTLAEAAVSTTGQLVEHLMMKNSAFVNQIIPNKPNEAEINERLLHPFEGAYVKTPEPGIYDNIAVLDFRGLYPSIIISYNIDPSTVCKECPDANVSPDGTRFVKDRMGIMPKVLKALVDERTLIKKAYKKDPDNKTLAARSQALKILANSFYGYLGYARSRWYSRECAASTTALGREAIKNVITNAEKAGFKTLYTDTDSVFLLVESKSKEDVIAFMNSINKTMPGNMELELEDFYTRGIFVGKRIGEIGAKKKYAMLSESGRIKISGFELVRRDWSKIARDTQRAVLDAILKEGSKEKAVTIVKDTINRVREGNMALSEFTIHTQLRKGITNYDITSPELSAAKKAMASGAKTKSELENGAIGYIITKHGNGVSEKAEIEETAKDYDPEYYINNQIIPATLKILKELGYSAEELKSGGTQRKL